MLYFSIWNKILIKIPLSTVDAQDDDSAAHNESHTSKYKCDDCKVNELVLKYSFNTRVCKVCGYELIL